MSLRPRGIRDSRSNRLVCRDGIEALGVLLLGIDQADAVLATRADVQVSEPVVYRRVAQGHGNTFDNGLGEYSCQCVRGEFAIAGTIVWCAAIVLKLVVSCIWASIKLAGYWRHGRNCNCWIWPPVVNVCFSLCHGSAFDNGLGGYLYVNASAGNPR